MREVSSDPVQGSICEAFNKRRGPCLIPTSAYRTILRSQNGVNP